MVRAVSLLIVPLIIIAEICSWHAVLTTRNLGHVFENSLWGIAAALIVSGLAAIALHSRGGHSPMLFIWAAGGLLYVAYMFVVDVPMYWSRWQADQSQGRRYLSLALGLGELSRPSRMSRLWQDWKSEVIWMTLYFSVGVWVSISLILADAK
jgi:predicted lysophospholipase L1 biosynthesis ABC-type transport system permease subunit